VFEVDREVLVNNESVLFFGGWLPIVRVIVVGVLGYLFLLLALRTVGPRTLAKTNMFDFIILVSIGSVFGRILTAQEVPLVEACVAYALLVGMHYALSWVRLRWKRLASMLDATPVMLFYRGQFVAAAMRKHRIMRVDVDTALRSRGVACLADVEAVVLEPDGSLSVIARGAACHELLPAG